MKKCYYCGKYIWPWQFLCRFKVPESWHMSCAMHKLAMERIFLEAKLSFSRDLEDAINLRNKLRKKNPELDIGITYIN